MRHVIGEQTRYPLLSQFPCCLQAFLTGTINELPGDTTVLRSGAGEAAVGSGGVHPGAALVPGQSPTALALPVSTLVASGAAVSMPSAGGVEKGGGGDDDDAMVGGRV